MASNPPVLTVRRNFARPPDNLVKQLAQAPTGWVVDANGRRGAMDYRIRPLTTRRSSAAWRCRYGRAQRDNLAPYAAIQHAKPGDVMVIATDDYQPASVVGDVLVGMAKNQGVAAFVTDGMVRDIDGLNAVGIPVFARGLSPNSPFKDGPGTIGLPILLAGVTVNPGDVVLATRTGSWWWHAKRWKAWSRSLPGSRPKEEKMEKAVADGARLPPGLAEIIAEKGVRYLD